MKLVIFFIFSAIVWQSTRAFEVMKPTKRPSPNPEPSPNPPTNPIKNIPRQGKLNFHMRRFATLPLFQKRGSRIVGITPWKDDLYVTTSTSGGLVYKVDPAGQATVWFDVANTLKRATGRILDCRSPAHGGLRSIAFPPDFERTGLFYTSLMEERPKDPENFPYLSNVADAKWPDSVVIEWRYNFKSKKVAPRSYRCVLRIAIPVNDHPIKQMVFQGRFLLIAHGDASTQRAVGGGGLRNDGLGKVIRINPKRRGDEPYTIPKSNPFIKDAAYKNELFAIGFRNPHNICYSKKHGIFVTDVGRDNIEEVNIIKGGRSYGWPEREGTFTHLVAGGTGFGIGVSPLPANDAANGYTYPNVQVGHFAPAGRKIYGQALAGSCPIENGSPLQGIFMYANFAQGGELYYSFVTDMKRAVTQGAPNTLTQADVYNATILYDHDNDVITPPLTLRSLRDVVRADESPKVPRVDLRFGVGSRGEVYWSSKKNGAIYLITSSVPGASR